MILVGISVELVRSTLCRQLNLSAATPPFVRQRIGRNPAKFLNGVNRSISNRGKCLPSRLVVGVDSIDRNVSLVSSRPSDGTLAVTARVVSAGQHDARLQT